MRKSKRKGSARGRILGDARVEREKKEKLVLQGEEARGLQRGNPARDLNL